MPSIASATQAWHEIVVMEKKGVSFWKESLAKHARYAKEEIQRDAIALTLTLAILAKRPPACERIVFRSGISLAKCAKYAKGKTSNAQRMVLLPMA